MKGGPSCWLIASAFQPGLLLNPAKVRELLKGKGKKKMRRGSESNRRGHSVEAINCKQLIISITELPKTSLTLGVFLGVWFSHGQPSKKS
jgi:hypothetical protein